MTFLFTVIPHKEKYIKYFWSFHHFYLLGEEIRGRKTGYQQKFHNARKEMKLLISTLKYMKVMKKGMGILSTYTLSILETNVSLADEFLFPDLSFSSNFPFLSRTFSLLLLLEHFYFLGNFTWKLDHEKDIASLVACNFVQDIFSYFSMIFHVVLLEIENKWCSC